jgi:hypothetical protein
MAEAGVNRRANRRGLATRESMLEAALRSLASGDPGAASANRIAESGATWGAVKYQFGIDGLWAAVLHRTAERRGELPSNTVAHASPQQRVAAIIDTLYEGLTMMADCFDLKLDDVKFGYDLGMCTNLGWYQLPKGSLGGSYIRYQGIVDGVSRIQTHLEWQMTPHTDPNWDIKGCYITQITGDPNIYNKHMIFPKPGTDLSNPEAFASIGMTVTGMPALNAIRAVVAARPGLLTSADLPLRGFAGRFKQSQQ